MIPVSPHRPRPIPHTYCRIRHCHIAIDVQIPVIRCIVEVPRPRCQREVSRHAHVMRHGNQFSRTLEAQRREAIQRSRSSGHDVCRSGSAVKRHYVAPRKRPCRARQPRSAQGHRMGPHRKVSVDRDAGARCHRATGFIGCAIPNQKRPSILHYQLSIIHSIDRSNIRIPAVIRLIQHRIRHRPIEFMPHDQMVLIQMHPRHARTRAHRHDRSFLRHVVQEHGHHFSRAQCGTGEREPAVGIGGCRIDHARTAHAEADGLPRQRRHACIREGAAGEGDDGIPGDGDRVQHGSGNAVRRELDSVPERIIRALQAGEEQGVLAFLQRIPRIRRPRRIGPGCTVAAELRAQAGAVRHGGGVIGEGGGEDAVFVTRERCGREHSGCRVDHGGHRIDRREGERHVIQHGRRRPVTGEFDFVEEMGADPRQAGEIDSVRARAQRVPRRRRARTVVPAAAIRAESDAQGRAGGERGDGVPEAFDGHLSRLVRQQICRCQEAVGGNIRFACVVVGDLPGAGFLVDVRLFLQRQRRVGLAEGGEEEEGQGEEEQQNNEEHAPAGQIRVLLFQRGQALLLHGTQRADAVPLDAQHDGGQCGPQPENRHVAVRNYEEVPPAQDGIDAQHARQVRQHQSPSAHHQEGEYDRVRHPAVAGQIIAPQRMPGSPHAPADARRTVRHGAAGMGRALEICNGPSR